MKMNIYIYIYIYYVCFTCAFVSIKKPLVFINLKLSQFIVYANVDFFNIKCPKIIKTNFILHLSFSDK